MARIFSLCIGLLFGICYTKAFHFMQFHLSVIAIISWVVGVLHLFPSFEVFPIFSSRKFKVSSLIIRFLIDLRFNLFKARYRDLVLFFCLWLSIFSALLIGKRQSFTNVCFGHQVTVPVCVGFLLSSLL